MAKRTKKTSTSTPSKPRENVAEILQKLATEEQQALATFQQTQREKREKLLANILHPLKQERVKLHQSINDANIRIGEIDREVAKLTGQKERPQRSGGGQRRQRITQEQKVEMGRMVYQHLAKNKGNEFRPADLEPFCPPLKAREAVAIWNEKGANENGQKIHYKGDKAARRYFLPA